MVGGNTIGMLVVCERFIALRMSSEVHERRNISNGGMQNGRVFGRRYSAENKMGFILFLFINCCESVWLSG